MQADRSRSLDLKALFRRRVRCDSPAFPLDAARCSLGLRPSRVASTRWLPCILHIRRVRGTLRSSAEAPVWSLPEQSVPAPGRSPSYRRTGSSGELVLLRCATFRRPQPGKPCWHPVTRPVPPPEGVPIPGDRRETPHPAAFPSSWSPGDPCRAFSAWLRRSGPRTVSAGLAVRSMPSAGAVGFGSACPTSPERHEARPSCSVAGKPAGGFEGLEGGTVSIRSRGRSGSVPEGV